VLTPDLSAGLEQQAQTGGQDFGELLISSGLMTDADLLALKAEIYQLPVITLADIEINRELSKEISDEVVRFYKILPFARDAATLKVALLNPENIDALEALKFIAAERGLKPEKYLISYREFDALARSYRTLTTEVGKELKSISEEASQKSLKIEKTDTIEQITAEAPVTRIVAAIVKHSGLLLAAAFLLLSLLL